MATLTNTQISVTYVGLLKTSANTVLTSTAQQITDGDGNNSIMFLSTAGVGIGGSPASGKELDVTGNVQVTGDLIVDNITIDGSTITNASGDLAIVNTNDDGDINFRSDNGSGGLTTYLAIDGGDEVVRFYKSAYLTDNIKALFGNSSDLQIYHDGSDSIIEQTQTGSGDLIIRNANDDKDIIFQSDDGSGGVATYLTLDGSAEKILIQKSTVFTGGGMDYGVDGTGADVIFYGDTSGRNMKWDQSEDHLLFTDNTKLKLGTGGDLEIYHDGSNTIIDNNTNDLIIRCDSDDIKILAEDDIVLRDNDDSTNFIHCINGGAVKLYHNGSEKFETTSTGVTVTGDITFGDSHFIGDDSFDNLQILASSGENVVIQAPTGNQIDLKTAGGSTLILDSSQDATFAGTLKSNTDFVVQVDADNNTSGSVFKILGGGGSELFRVNEAGQAGIGTTSPAMKLDVDAGVSDSVARFTSTDSLAYMSFVDSSTTSNTSVAIGADANNLAFYTGTSFGTEKMRLTSSGLLGLGTTSPAMKLDVDAGVSDSVARFTSTDSNARILIADNDDIMYLGTQSNKFYIGANDSATSGNLIIDSSGQVGIGTTSPSSLLHLESASSPTLRLVDTTNTTILLAYAQNSDAHIGTYSNHSLVLDTNSTTALTIDTSQNATFAGNISLADSKILRIGSSNDLDLLHDGTNSQISNNTGDLQIINNADDKDIAFFSDDGSGGTTEYFRLDGSAEANVFSKNITLNGSHSITNDSNGHLNINSAGGKQIFIDAQGQLRLDSGGAQAFTLDSSQDATFTGNINLADSKKVSLGASDDFNMSHNGTDTTIQNITGHLNITNKSNDSDIIFKSDDGSGGITTYFFLDGSDVSTKILTQKVIMSNLPTSDPNNAGQLYNDSGTLKISAG